MQDVPKTSKLFSERLIHVQITACVKEENAVLSNKVFEYILIYISPLGFCNVYFRL